MDAVLYQLGARTHGGTCDPKGTELWCLACKAFPAACRCVAAGLRPRLWRPHAAAMQPAADRAARALASPRRRREAAA